MRRYKWHYLSLIAILLPVLAYGSLLAAFTLDLPKSDDYGDSLRTLININNANQLSEKWQILFKQHNEHHTLFNRLSYLLSLTLFNKLDYTFLILLGNFSVLLLALTYLKSIKNDTANYLFALPVVYLVLQPSAYDSMFWAMAALSNYTVMLWAALCCFFLGKNSYSGLSASMIFATLATFTQANGLLTLPLGAAFLLYAALKNTDNHARWRLIIWLVCSTMIAACFLWDYQVRDLNKLPVEGESAKQAFRTGSSFIAIAHWYFALLGSSLSFGNANIASIIGLGATALTCFLSIKGLFKNQTIIFIYLIFVFSSIMMAAVGRSVFIDIQWSQSPRYTFYSSQVMALLAGICVLNLSCAHKGKTGYTQLCAIIITGSIIISISSYAINIEKIQKQQFRALAAMWIWNTKKKEGLLAPLVSNPGETLEQAGRLNLYHPPAISYLPSKDWGRFNTAKHRTH